MPVRMKPTSVIKRQLGIQKDGPVHKFFTNACYIHMDKYVPMNTGDLRTVVSMTPHSITYHMPYAEAQYRGVVHGTEVKNYTTPGTGPYWDKKMVSAEINDVIEEVQDYIKTHGGR